MIHFSKKAQGMPLNVVIIAALVLIVLIVMIVIFTGKLGIFARGTTSCAETHGGECSGECSEKPTGSGRIVCECYGENEIMIRGTDCESDDSNEVCCVSLIPKE